jgi:pimeloyl-ACP methyl ester carboxylesterase
MSEINHDQDAYKAPIVVVSGLLTGSECQSLYGRALDNNKNWNLPPKKRFITPFGRGLKNPEEMFKRAEEEVLTAYDVLNEPIVAVGHSLGALIIQKVLVANPQVKGKVLLTAGVHEGQIFSTPSSVALTKSLTLLHLLENPEAAKILKHDSDFMTEHIETVASEWSDEMEVHGAYTTLDDLLPPPHGMRLELPEGQQAERLIITLPIPGIESGLKFLTRNRKADVVRSWQPALHANIVRHPAFIKYLRGMQTDMVAIRSVPETTPSIYTNIEDAELPEAA